MAIFRRLFPFPDDLCDRGSAQDMGELFLHRQMLFHPDFQDDWQPCVLLSFLVQES